MRTGNRFATALLVLLCAIVAAGAQAATVTLDTEFDDGITGDLASVEIVEDAGALIFTVTVGDALGGGADLHKFYFNVADDISGLALTTLDGVQTVYSLQLDPPVAGGAGSSFDVGISFGNGAGAKGNGVLQQASFAVAADQPLTIGDLSVSSFTSAGIEANFAAHVQGTALVSGSTSETVGGTLPEPALTSLLGLSFLALLARGRR